MYKKIKIAINNNYQIEFIKHGDNNFQKTVQTGKGLNHIRFEKGLTYSDVKKDIAYYTALATDCIE